MDLGARVLMTVVVQNLITIKTVTDHARLITQNMFRLTCAPYGLWG